MPRVSVITPAHDAGEFLPETLRSVHAQTFDDWEVVVVDDGSTDHTWSILESAGPRVRALRNPVPTGPAAARNRALAEANGELIVFLDADDLLLPTYLQSQIDCLTRATEQGRKVGLVACDALLLDAGAYADGTYLDMTRSRGRALTLELVLRRNPIYISSLVPAEVGASVGWFDVELFGTEDFGLWLKILESGFEARPEPGTARRVPAASRNGLVEHRAPGCQQLPDIRTGACAGPDQPSPAPDRAESDPV
jgi:glycosyltransferase involved in cell wall biosynthesis